MNGQHRAAIADLIRDVPDFPKPGVVFKDITPLLRSPTGFALAIEELLDAAPEDIDVVIAMEARGFIFGAPVALALGAGLVPVRKPGKLPAASLSVSYDLEYGSETLAVHRDALRPGDRVLMVDDVLATGGTAGATAELVRQLGGNLVQLSVLVELEFLGGREYLRARGVSDISSVVTVRTE